MVDIPVAPEPLPALYDWLARRYAVPRARAYERAVPPRVRVVWEATPLTASPRAEILPSYVGGTALLEAVRRGTGGSWCLRPLSTHPRGRLIAELIGAATGRGAAIVAVPEVRHGSLVLEELGSVFSGLARVDTSRDESERASSWMAMAGGHSLAGGGRAAVFAPSPRCALIVIDESHDAVYKEDRSFRYDARRVALERARLEGGVCVLISQTPSLEHGAAAAAGRMGSVVPSREARRQARPAVELVAVPSDGGLGDDLHSRIREALRAGRSVALLAPRTGYSRALWCAQCRRSVRCPLCEAGLAFELAERRVGCRRCGFAEVAPSVCPSCGASDLRHLGRGAERFAEQLAKAFPRSPVVHMDRAASEGGPRDWAGAGIYVTTWFGTKPELRPQVSLVGVLDADALIRRLDFRAAELAHQVLAEMAAWAGPAADGGRLLIQTDDPGHHAVQAIARADYEFFLERELELRRELSYPPFSELIKLSVTGSEAGAFLEEALAAARAQGARVLGPIEAPFPTGGRSLRGRGQQGLQALLKCRAAQPVAEALRDILPRVPRGTRLRVDVDPR